MSSSIEQRPEKVSTVRTNKHGQKFKIDVSGAALARLVQLTSTEMVTSVVFVILLQSHQEHPISTSKLQVPTNGITDFVKHY